MVDQLLLSAGEVAKLLLPILGVLVLIYLCILLKKVWKLIDSITGTVNRLDPTMKLVDQSIEKMQAPLDTVVKYSHTLDDVHDKTKETVVKTVQAVNENADKVKDFVSNKLTEETEEGVQFKNPFKKSETENKESADHE